MTRTAVRERIIAALEASPCLAAELEQLAFTTKRNTLKHLKQLREEGAIHVCRWERGTAGPFRPVYQWGPGKDARRPKPLTLATRLKTYRRRMREKFGPYYAVIYEAQKQHLPGRKIVVDGQVVYQQ